ncbi:MAG: hypothetical protein AAF203_03195 [Pseudomonadota bacterium]
MFLTLSLGAFYSQAYSGAGKTFTDPKDAVMGVTSSRFSEPYPTFSIEDIEKVMATLPNNHLSELIRRLPVDLTLFRAEALFSRSLQCATPKAPRVLFFSTNGQVYCSFNSGDPKDYEGLNRDCLATINHLECLYRDNDGFMQTRTYEFAPEPQYAANFKVVPDFNKEYDEIVSRHLGDIKIYEDPQTCASCHHSQKEPLKVASRVIMDQYFLWPGFFGGVDQFYPNIPGHMEWDAQTQFFGNFKNPRYQALPKFGDRQGHARVLEDKGSASPYFGITALQNLNFSQLVNNSYRMLGVLKQLPLYEKFLPLLAVIGTSTANSHFSSCIISDSDWKKSDRAKMIRFFPNHLREPILSLFNNLYDETLESPYEHIDNNLDLFEEIFGKEKYHYGRLEEENGFVDSESEDEIDFVTARRQGTKILPFGARHARENYVFRLALFRLIFELSGYDSWQLSGNEDGTFYFNSAEHILLEESTPSTPLILFMDANAKKIQGKATEQYATPDRCEELAAESREGLRSLSL